MADNISFKKAPAFIVTAALLVFIDIMLKGLCERFLKGAGPVSLIDGILELRYVENTGAAFGIMHGMRYVFIVLAAAVSLGAFCIFLGTPKNKRFLPFDICLVGIVSGALGNAIDRIRYGYVIDFIYFKPINFPVFNFADILVTCSAFLLIILFVFVYREDDLECIPFMGKKRT